MGGAVKYIAKRCVYRDGRNYQGHFCKQCTTPSSGRSSPGFLRFLPRASLSVWPQLSQLLESPGLLYMFSVIIWASWATGVTLYLQASSDQRLAFLHLPGKHPPSPPALGEMQMFWARKDLPPRSALTLLASGHLTVVPCGALNICVCHLYWNLSCAHIYVYIYIYANACF